MKWEQKRKTILGIWPSMLFFQNPQTTEHHSNSLNNHNIGPNRPCPPILSKPNLVMINVQESPGGNLGTELGYLLRKFQSGLHCLDHIQNDPGREVPLHLDSVICTHASVVWPIQANESVIPGHLRRHTQAQCKPTSFQVFLLVIPSAPPRAPPRSTLIGAQCGGTTAIVLIWGMESWNSFPKVIQFVSKAGVQCLPPQITIQLSNGQKNLFSAQQI